MDVLHTSFFCIISTVSTALCWQETIACIPFLNEFDFYIAQLDTDDVLKLEIILSVISH
jgi:hypothetical protein